MSLKGFNWTAVSVIKSMSMKPLAFALYSMLLEPNLIPNVLTCKMIEIDI
jgi:hypothetical protein